MIYVLSASSGGELLGFWGPTQYKTLLGSRFFDFASEFSQTWPEWAICGPRWGKIAENRRKSCFSPKNAFLTIFRATLQLNDQHAYGIVGR